ncbi:methylated-DNA--[protein]-cysteine S-methyltransferase [Pseudooceanicola sp.]|uniref:methylated-DNA--[protein]-cysteine S-methyltransferase n=1 Tax=Pseudooceanicola sp. TaxID=1914328 RepID=UPI00405980BE
MNVSRVDTPVGPLFLQEEGGLLVRVTWREAASGGGSEVLEEAARQIHDYFAGARQGFDLPLEVRGSDLQRAVCAEMAAIPFGKTVTYGEIARRLGVPAQAVGQACGGNPLPVVIPCHRVLGASGLGGFSGEGGVETKVALLRHEGAAGLLI